MTWRGFSSARSICIAIAGRPRILDHHEAMVDCAAAGFRALVYKDHFYPGMAHAVLLEKLFPDRACGFSPGSY
jgi:hypothetical protein